jgi:ketosteroid isomerase-like protein
VEAFERAVSAVKRRDVDALLEELDPDVEWHPLAQVMLGGQETVYRGHQGVRDLFRELDEVTAEIHPQISEIRDLGDRIVAVGRIRARGKESGAETESAIGWVAEYERGKMIRIRDYLDPQEALNAVGLPG